MTRELEDLNVLLKDVTKNVKDLQALCTLLSRDAGRYLEAVQKIQEELAKKGKFWGGHRGRLANLSGLMTTTAISERTGIPSRAKAIQSALQAIEKILEKNPDIIE